MLIAAISSFHVVRIRGEETAKRVEEVREDVEKTREEVNETEEEIEEEAKVNVAQTVQLENISKLLFKLDKKLDKDLKDE